MYTHRSGDEGKPDRETAMLVQQRNYGELSTFSTYLEEQLVEALTRIEAVSECIVHGRAISISAHRHGRACACVHVYVVSMWMYLST
jgi:hypothetical protein